MLNTPNPIMLDSFNLALDMVTVESSVVKLVILRNTVAEDSLASD